MRLLDWHDGQFEFSPCAIGGRDELGRRSRSSCSSTRACATSRRPTRRRKSGADAAVAALSHCSSRICSLQHDVTASGPPVVDARGSPAHAFALSVSIGLLLATRRARRCAARGCARTRCGAPARSRSTAISTGRRGATRREQSGFTQRFPKDGGKPTYETQFARALRRRGDLRRRVGRRSRAVEDPPRC